MADMQAPPATAVVAAEPVLASPAEPAARPARRSTAEAMAKKQREISISEFFAKNRHLLGFDNPRKALLTCVKEAVDNALDACEEAGILPSLLVHITQTAEDRFRVLVRDNGPGIVEKNIRNVFGKLLYGSKFHRLRMSRGQQGIGISAAGMYGLMTTGKSVQIISRTGPKKPAHYCELQIDTKRNEAEIIKSRDCADDELARLLHLREGEAFEHGTQVAIEMKAAYLKGRQSVDAYIEQTAIANPHAEIHYRPPTGDPVRFPRAHAELPPEPKEIKPHPYGIELGTLLKMLKEAENRYLSAFLQDAFCRVTGEVAHEICKKAGLKASTDPTEMQARESEALFKAIQDTRIMAPPTDCLVPIGTKAILAGLLKEIKADFYTAVERKPAVYRGNPFLIEVGLAFGGELGQFVGKDDIQIDTELVDKTRKKAAADEGNSTQARLIRFANRVPLQYQQGACCTFKSVVETKWGNYGVPQRRGNLPDAPMVVMVHVASVWVPFTSESKEAIADYDEIRKEIKLALQEAGRKLSAYINRRNRMRREGERRSIFLRYIPEVVAAAKRLDPDVDPDKLRAGLLALARAKTEEADTVLDDEGKVVKVEGGEEGDLSDTIIVRDADGSETAHAAVADALRSGNVAASAALANPAALPAAAPVPAAAAQAGVPGTAPPKPVQLPATGARPARGKRGDATLFDDAA